MNWLTRAINFGEKVKKILKKRPSKETSQEKTNEQKAKEDKK